MLSQISLLSQQIATLFASKTQKLSVAESVTGGGLAYALTQLPGSSVWFERGFVTYSIEAKMEMLGVPYETLSRFGVVSVETAQAMAKGALLHSQAHMSLSTTGYAGPSAGLRPLGTVCFGLAQHNKVIAHQQPFNGDRESIRQQAIIFALSWLLKQTNA